MDGKGSQSSVNASLEGKVKPILNCKLSSCKGEFTPKRKDMVFCCKAHRVEYYTLAFKIGEKALEVLK